jgi:glycerol-3-phosphate acyltransferase PlsY
MTPVWTLDVGWSDTAIALLIGYLLGSIPFGLLFSFAFGEGDVRKIGSGAIGATNVLRTGNYAAAGLTVLFDTAKGAAAVLLVRHYFGGDTALFAALGAMLGHLFPIWLKFKGGKGIAVGLCAFAIWLATLALFRISSLAALVAAVAAPVCMALFGQVHAAMLCVVLAVLALVMHRENFRRLLNGTEPRVWGNKSGIAS